MLEVRGAQAGIACGLFTPCPARRGPVLRAPPCCFARSPSRGMQRIFEHEPAAVRALRHKWRECGAVPTVRFAGEVRLPLAAGDLHAPGGAQRARDPGHRALVAVVARYLVRNTIQMESTMLASARALVF